MKENDFCHVFLFSINRKSHGSKVCYNGGGNQPNFKDLIKE